MTQEHIDPTYCRSFAKVDLDAIVHNFDALKTRVQPGVKACCVVKADGYGHGSVPIAKTLESKTDFFAVAALEEGVVLREAGIQKPILVLSYTSEKLYDKLIRFDITPTIYNIDEARALSAVA